MISPKNILQHNLSNEIKFDALFFFLMMREWRFERKKVWILCLWKLLLFLKQQSEFIQRFNRLGIVTTAETWSDFSAMEISSSNRKSELEQKENKIKI